MPANFSGVPRTNSLSMAEHDRMIDDLCHTGPMAIIDYIEYLLLVSDSQAKIMAVKLWEENINYFTSGGYKLELN